MKESNDLSVEISINWRILLSTNQIKSNHFYCHITTAQVPWWMKFLRACSRQCKKTKQKCTYGQYIFTDSTEDNVQNTHTYTQYTQCTIKTYFVTNAPIHIIHRIYTSALCPHLCIVICEGVTGYNLQWIGCATDSCAKVQQIIHMQCRGCAFMVSSDSRCVSTVCACSPVELC